MASVIGARVGKLPFGNCPLATALGTALWQIALWQTALWQLPFDNCPLGLRQRLLQTITPKQQLTGATDGS
jgi:hypothetical protein